MSSRHHFLEPLLRAGGSPHTLVNERTGATVARAIELAGDSSSRNRGLLGRKSLPDDSALVLAPCAAIHTFFMKFTIDAVFVDRQGLVLRVSHGLRPWRLGASFGGFAVIELSSGGARRAGIEPGDRLVLA